MWYNQDMPELPEVETVVRSLRPYLTGKKIVDIDIRKDKSFPENHLSYLILGQPIEKIWRRAKLIIMDIQGSSHLVVHLKMTGQLLYRSAYALAGGGHPTNDLLNQLPGKHTRVILTLSDAGQLFFNDLRIFGWLKIMDDETLAQELSHYGPDANQIDNPEGLYTQFQRCRRPIKQVLMDNQYLAGIGNIYAAELCYRCRLDPRTPARQLTLEQVSDLARQARELLTAAIEQGGTTFDGRYVDADGKRGNFEQQLDVYGRAGQACHRCGATLENVKIGGRSSVFCPRCQT